MAKKTKYFIFNATDGIYASPNKHTQEQAEEWISSFRENMKKAQGYYLTSYRERIPVEEVEFDLITC